MERKIKKVYRIDPALVKRYRLERYLPEKRYTVRLSRELGREVLPKQLFAKLNQIEADIEGG